MTRLTLNQINAIHGAAVALEELSEYLSEDIHYVDDADARKHAAETVAHLRRTFPELRQRGKRKSVAR